MIKKKVGDIIQSWIPGFLTTPNAGCACKSKRLMMNAQGPDGVEKNINYWVRHFLDQKKHLRKPVQNLADIVFSGLLEKMILRACKLSRERSK